MAGLRIFLPIIALPLLLGACGSLGWLGESEAPPLPGKRVPVLTGQFGAQVDPALAGQAVPVPAPVENGAWPQSGGNAQHNLGSLAWTESPRVAWTSSLGSGESSDGYILAQPIVAEGRVYGMDAGTQVSAFDANTGSRVWRVDLRPKDARGAGFGGGLAYDDGRLFVTTGFGSVVALNPANGQELWRHNGLMPYRAAPLAINGLVLAVSLDNQTLALRADSGTVAWTHTALEEQATLLGGAAPASDGMAAVVGYSSGELAALLIDSGRELWSDSLAALRRTDQMAGITSIRGNPVIDRGLVFAVGNSGRMNANDLRRGLRFWEINVSSTEMPWVAGDHIFVVTTDAELLCLTVDGGVRWAVKLPAFTNPEDRSGAIQWRGPLLAGGRLVLASSTGEMRFFSPADGQALGSLSLPAGAAVAPSIANRTVYLSTKNGDLVAIR